MNSSANEKRKRKAKARKFYIIGPDARIGGKGGWEMENLPALLMGRRVLVPPPGQRGFPDFSEPPRLVFDKSLGRNPRDLEQFHDYWLVSDRMKGVLEQLDPEAFGFVKCVSQNRDRSVGPAYWLCDVLRILDAVDEEKSRVRIEYDPPDHRKRYSLLGGANLFFREEAVGPAHIFRLQFLFPRVICDDLVRDACKEADLKGIGFHDAAKY
ncbi:DUF1629 domain-containing protein [Bradyrhizobium sp. CCGUVB1N3]|uniref:imm11 family protein n=1 Tax=Bradyrhizobium sp. CCGUVB1N3 TaxID=2949629 RepID=UPI0020B35722|nr:DUF1629 domain-containing protein [Bradyrhizobium sp. CCGUVB1N3]MCP3476990.1 DUF1629 domain-containing protein [Bradyrhizobium sp. CCGUVB1N3]